MIRQLGLALGVCLISNIPAFGQPTAPPPRPATPSASPATVQQLEAAAELLEAHLDVKRAYVRAAEVAVKTAANNRDRLGRQPPGNVSREDLERADIELDAAKALLEIRKAEMREVEVKLHQTRRQLDEAKAAGPDPILLARLEAARARIVKAKAALDMSKQNLERIKRLAEMGIVAKFEFDQAVSAIMSAEADVRIATAEADEIDAAIRGRR